MVKIEIYEPILYFIILGLKVKVNYAFELQTMIIYVIVSSNEPNVWLPVSFFLSQETGKYENRTFHGVILIK